MRVGNWCSGYGRREVKSGKREDEDVATADREEVVVERVRGRRREVLVLGEKIQSQGGGNLFFGRDRE